MSGTVMKFGPQWIRTLTDGAVSSVTTNTNNTNSNSAYSSYGSSSSTTTSSNSNSSSSASTSATTSANATTASAASAAAAAAAAAAAGKYKLAEYRYGREEMLALYEQEMEAPEGIRNFTDLYIEKARMPMAMIQMSEEEVKLITRNWNSEAVLRSSGKVATVPSTASGGAGSGGPTGLASTHNMGSSTLNDRDINSGSGSRQLSDGLSSVRGLNSSGQVLTAAGVLSSSPRGPPGSLSRIPLEQRGLLSSLNSRGPPSTIRNLVGRGPNLYMRSQSHEDGDGNHLEASSLSGTTGGNAFDARFSAGQVASRQPNSLRARFENRSSQQPSTAGLKQTSDGLKVAALDGDASLDRGQRSVFDRLPSKYSVDDKIIRKDANGRPLQSNDWRSRDWLSSGAGGASGANSLEGARGKGMMQDDSRGGGSWRSSRGGGVEDWRSGANNNSATNSSSSVGPQQLSSSSWYVKTDEQRNNLRSGGAVQNQENLSMSFSGKRDTLRRPSIDDRHGDEDDDVSHIQQQKQNIHQHHQQQQQQQQRHRRDSLPEWSIGDPLAGDKVGSFDASGAFREITRDEGNDSSFAKEKTQQDQSNYQQENKSSNATLGNQDWRLKATRESTNATSTSNAYNNNMSDSRNNTSDSLSEIERLSLTGRKNSVSTDLGATASETTNDSRKSAASDGRNKDAQMMQDRFNDANFHNHANHNQQHQQQQQSYLANIANSTSTAPATTSTTTTNATHSSLTSVNDEDGFAHLERAAEIMVAEWTAEEERESSTSPTFLLGNKLNINREQQQHIDNQANLIHNNNDARHSNQLHQLNQQQQQSVEIQNSSSAMFNDSNNQNKKFILLPFNHEDSLQWFYRDTQGVIQGPFSANEMFEWYKAGYFVKELLVRRACDELFYPLGDVIKMWDRIPFAPAPIPPPPVTAQALLQLRAVTKQLALAAGLSSSQGQIPPNAFSLTHPGTVLLHGPILQQQQQVLAANSLNQSNSNPQEQQAGIRQILEATRQHDQALVQQQQQQQQRAAAAAAGIMPGNITDQNEMQNQLRQLLAQLKNREGFSNLNAQQQQEVLVRQFVASRAAFPNAEAGNLQEQDQNLLQRARMAGPFSPFFSSEQERFRYQQRVEMERRQKEEAEKQNLFIMEQRMKAEEEKQRIMSELQKRQQQQQKQKEENDKQQQRQEAEQERLLKLSQLKQQQLAKQQEEFRQQMMNQQRIQQQQQQEKQQKQQQQQLTSIQQQQQQQIERAKKAALAQQVQQEQQRKTAWSTVSKPDQEPVSLATLQKMQEEEKEKEREKQHQLQQQMQQTNQQQQLQQQLQRQMTWANAAQQSRVAPVKTLAEIQKEEEDRLNREKQKKTKVQPTVPNAGVWNNAASHLSWKNPPADS